ncbi:Ig-like domain-containing protein, partial [Tenacibaculum sp.]|nr:Ig-like domain-containing protein [Tenacibaculum sp.]
MKNYFLQLLFFFSIVCYSSNGQYRLIITDTPSSTIMIGWNQTSGSNPIVYYGTTDHGSIWSNYTSNKTVDRTVNYKGMNNTFTKLTGLQPNTSYYFVIKDDEGVSNRFWFKTAPNTNDRMSFIAGGDSRNNRTPRKNANLLVSKLKPTAVFFGGDMTNGDSNSEWKTWFDDWQLTTASDGRMFPIIPARGNHEDSNSSIYNLFNVPSSSVYYEVTFGNNLYSIFTLNSEISAGGNQLTWLNQKLNSNNSIWKSAQYHKPMRPHVSSKSEGNDEYSSWSQLFYDKGVNLVFESDSHTVKTTWPVKPCSGGSNCEEGFARDDSNGTIYVGEGCWGAPLRSSNDAKNWTRNNSTFNQFKWVFVDETKIEIRTIKVDNASSVTELSNTNPFSIPTNLDIWNPTNGSVVTITKTNVSYPKVTITSPTSDSTNTVNTPININATASDSDGTVNSVKFYVNNNLINTDTNAPYSFNWTPITNNQSYSIKAIAQDNEGNETTSDEVTIYIGIVSKTIATSITRGNDDVEEYQSSGQMYLNSTDLELVKDGNSKGNQHVGLLFRTLSIPKDAKITNAYIQFTADETNTGTTSLSIKVQNSTNPTDITSQNYNVSSRNYYTQVVNWNPSSWNTIGASGTLQRTPNLKNLVQHIVNKSQWNLGNKMLFYISGTGERTAESYEGSSAKAPKLVISFETGDGGGNPPTCENISVQIVFDQYSKETSWSIKDTLGETVMSGGNYSKNNGESISIEKCLPLGCYSFTIKDTYGDGICCNYGNGSYKVSKNSGNTILASGGNFKNEESKEICISNTASKNEMNISPKKQPLPNNETIYLYPNPASATVYLSTATTESWYSEIFTLT